LGTPQIANPELRKDSMLSTDIPSSSVIAYVSFFSDDQSAQSYPDDYGIENELMANVKISNFS
jgi:putative IMPACT (imprinted ancient) family translation regulator